MTNKTADPEKTKQIDRLDRAKRLTDRMWKWAGLGTIPVVGGLATTLGLKFTIDTASWAVVLIIAAAVGVALTGASHVAADVFIASGKRELDRGRFPKATLPAVIIAIGFQATLLAATVIVWCSAIGVAAADALDEDPLLDDRLADRVAEYEGALDEANAAKIAEADAIIDAFCTEHLEDDKATNIFREVCGLFETDNGQELPDRESVGKLLKRLRSGGEGKGDK